MPSRFRPAFVVTVAAVGASLAAAACATTTCPEKINSGDSCSGTRECKLKEGCGLNGYRCENGTWREVMTFCNPPPPPQDPPIAPVATDARKPIGPPAPDAAAPVAATPDAAAPVAMGCPATIVEGKSCATDGMKCQEKQGCGSNGWRCEKGKWRESVTYCNPPPPPPTR